MVLRIFAILLLTAGVAFGQTPNQTILELVPRTSPPTFVGPANPLPTTTTPSGTSAPLTAETNSFQFTVTNGQDNALPLAPSSPGLTLPGRVCIDYPQQAYGASTTNTAYININWDGVNALTTPHDQLAAGEHEICKYVTTTTPPHLAVNNGSASPVIGVTN